MSEQYFLEKCIVTAEDVKGSYSSMVSLDVDSEAKQMYENMLMDTGKHLNTLNNRLKYLKEQNPKVAGHNH